MVAIAVWAAIVSLVGMVVSAALYGHRQHKDPRWAALDAQLEAQILAELTPASRQAIGERRRFAARSSVATRRLLPNSAATTVVPTQTRRNARVGIATRRFAQLPSRRSTRSRS